MNEHLDVYCTDLVATDLPIMSFFEACKYLYYNESYGDLMFTLSQASQFFLIWILVSCCYILMDPGWYAYYGINLHTNYSHLILWQIVLISIE